MKGIIKVKLLIVSLVMITVLGSVITVFASGGYVGEKTSQTAKTKKITITKLSTSSIKKLEANKKQLAKKQGEIVLAKRLHYYKYVKTVFPEKDDYSYKEYKCTTCKATKREKIENPGSGYVGTLVISDVGLKVKVYDYAKTNPYTKPQTITDRKDSAAMLELDSQVFIADHKHQGFSKIKKVTAGKTIATLGSKTYKCIQKFNGRNKEYYLADNNGTNIKKYGADIAMYTCNQDWRHVTITLWNEIE